MLCYNDKRLLICLISFRYLLRVIKARKTWLAFPSEDFNFSPSTEGGKEKSNEKGEILGSESSWLENIPSRCWNWREPGISSSSKSRNVTCWRSSDRTRCRRRPSSLPLPARPPNSSSCQSGRRASARRSGGRCSWRWGRRRRAFSRTPRRPEKEMFPINSSTIKIKRLLLAERGDIANLIETSWCWMSTLWVCLLVAVIGTAEAPTP